ncbi:5'-3' exonuclease [Teredinibacter franksiae]|uniref:5'-3' exonuclease n=1 Tax=Teredinibacter franksiae TaxID=2761453 RepID=UPI0016251DFC|nr:5'-3' exonuclease H3TH domain-containing protein [Teredinibacter franksiae]
MSARQPTAFLIDASIYIFRYYFALPDNWWAENGYSTSAVYGYSQWLVRFLQTQNPRYVAACFDESLKSCFRNDIYENYKVSRALPDEALAYQLEACKQITELMGVSSYASHRYEADDLIAALAKKCRRKKLGVCVVSRDKDLSQVVQREGDSLWDAPEGEKMNASAVKTKLGVAPHQVAAYLALVGDSSDNIPGVPGVGSKTAGTLLSHFDNWIQLRNNISAIPHLPIRGAASLADKIERHKTQIEMALQLTQLVENAPLGRRFTVNRKKPNLPALFALSKVLGFGQNFETSLNRLTT